MKCLLCDLHCLRYFYVIYTLGPSKVNLVILTLQARKLTPRKCRQGTRLPNLESRGGMLEAVVGVGVITLVFPTHAQFLFSFPRT